MDITELLPESLTDQQKADIKSLFEEKVNNKVGEEIVEAVADARKEIETQIQEKYEQDKNELIDNVSSFLEHFTSEYIKDNEVAIKSNVRVSVQESFMDGLAELFKEHYIEIPEDKIDIYAESVEALETADSKNAELIKSNASLTEELNKLKKENAIITESKDLSDTEAEKLSQMLEGVEYGDNFDENVKLMKSKITESKSDKGDDIENKLFEENNNGADDQKKDYSSFSAFIKAAK